MEIVNHLLQGANIKHVQSPNVSGPYKAGQPDTIIIHYTAGASAESSVRTLMDPNSKASAHLVIGRDGAITQLVPFNIIAWHAGKSSYGNRIGYNNYSIGIEIDNAGPLTKSGDIYRSWFGKEYSANEVIEGIHRNEKTPRFWHAYTDAQIQVVEEISRLLVATYNMKSILGHEEISPIRKSDPGPAFPLDRFRDRVLNAGRDSDEDEPRPEKGRVGVDKLNIRANPDAKAEKVAMPLAKGAKVKILEESNGWYKVTTEVEGWVSKQYVVNE